MFRRLGRHIKEGFLGVGRHFGMALSSSTAVAITLTLIGVFMVLTYNLVLMTNTIESSISLSALIEYDSGDQVNLQRIENEIKAVNGVSSVTFHSKEEEFDFYVNSNTDPELKEFYEAYRDENPFRDAFIITINDGTMLQEVTKNVEAINGVHQVYDGGANTYKLVDVLENIRLFGGILVIALGVLAIYLVYNTIHITIDNRKDEIWIMRNVGAKNGYVRAPFLVEGIIIGFSGSIVPILIIGGLYYYLYNALQGTLFGSFALVPPFPFLFYLAAVLAGTGVLVGFIGSYISVCKYLRIRR